MSNSLDIEPTTVVVTHGDPPTVTPSTLPVVAAAGTLVRVIWTPAVGTEITSVTGFPSSVNIEGPDPEGRWTGSYEAPAYRVVWSYSVTARQAGGHKTHNHDPEIDNTPPPPGS